MKKLFAFLGMFLCFVLFASCELPNGGSQNNPNEDKNDSNSSSDALELSNILINYSKKKKITINETTSGCLINGNEVSSTRITNVDFDNSYFYSKINDNYSIQYNNSIFYKVLNEKYTKLDISASNTYDLTGITNLFSSNNYKISNNVAKRNITSPEISSYSQVFDNVNLDLNTNYKYNPSSIMKVAINLENNDIKSIDLDLSLVFGSYFSSLTKTITFSNDNFTKVEFNNEASDSINKDFLVQTASKIDTYVIEMIQEYGDSIYIKSGDFDMLIDAGQYQDGANVDKILSEKCIDKKLDVLVATHGHADHLGGFEGGALNSINEVGMIIDFGYVDNGSYGYKSVKESFINKGAKYFSAYDCVYGLNDASKVFKFSDDLKIEVLNTGQYAKTNTVLTSEEYKAENDFSVVIKLTFKNNTYLYTGDLSGELENKFSTELLKEDIKDMTVYKAAHHGASSHNSNNQDFLNYINPKICVSSAAIVDSDQPYDHSINGEIKVQHPRPAFVRWILNTPTIIKTKQYYFNGTMGTIYLSDDGDNLPIVNGLGATKGYSINNVKVTGEENLVFYKTRMYNEFYLR